MQDLLNLKEQWQQLEQLSRDLLSDNDSLMVLLENSGRIIEDLEIRLASATRGVEDAIENWWHMELLAEGLREEIKTADLQIDGWERYTISLQRRLNIQPFIVTGVAGGFGIGGYLIADGNWQAGTAAIAFTGLVYFVGRYVFRWW
jgi:hypothetical protein